MQLLQYNLHLLLNYKYKFIINLVIYMLLLLFINNTPLTYCMTEGDIPSIAETKSTNIEIITREYTELQKKSEDQQLQINDYKEQILHLQHELFVADEKLEVYENEINNLELKNARLQVQLKPLVYELIEESPRISDFALQEEVDFLFETKK